MVDQPKFREIDPETLVRIQELVNALNALDENDNVRIHANRHSEVNELRITVWSGKWSRSGYGYPVKIEEDVLVTTDVSGYGPYFIMRQDENGEWCRTSSDDWNKQ